MLIHCDQCHSKYKITIKKIPSKPVNFRCGKCQKTILISPEDLKKDLEAASIPEATAAAPAPEKAEPQPPEPPPPSPPLSASPPAEGSQTETVQLSCLKCGIAFVKPKEDKARLCYQCRIDAIVTKIRDKYGVTQEVKVVEVVEAKNKYSFRTPDGLILGPIKLKTAVVLVREKKLKGIEEVSKDGGEFRPLAEFEEIIKLFPDLPAPQPAPAPKPPEVQEEDIPLEIEEPSQEAPAPPPAKTKPKEVSPPLKPVEASKPAPPPPAKPVPSPPAPESVSRYKIRYPDGLVLGPVRLLAVEDLVAAGNLTGQEEVQKDSGSWKQFLDYPELKALVASGEEIAEDEVVELTDMLEEVS